MTRTTTWEPHVWHHWTAYYRRRVRELWRKTWWLECTRCQHTQGPYLDPGAALKVMQLEDAERRRFRGLM